MTRHAPRALALAAIPLALAACSSTTPPRLSIADVRVTGVTDAGSSMLITLRAENPNSEPLPLRTIDYRVTLAEREVFSGTRAAEGVLPRFGTLDLALPVGVPADVRPAGESDFRLSVVLRYLAPGKVAETLYDAGLRRPSVASSGTGTVDLGG